jgi:hypothetical protein
MRNSARPDIVTVVLLNVAKDFTASWMSSVCAVISSGKSRSTASEAFNQVRPSLRADADCEHDNSPAFLLTIGLIKIGVRENMHHQTPEADTEI